MTIIYANGDSFFAGDELGDFMIKDHPGYLNFKTPQSILDLNQSWYHKTFDPSHPLSKDRIFKKNKIQDFNDNHNVIAKVAKKLNLNYVNHSLGGVSYDRISRTTITGLLELKKTTDDIICLIGTTDPGRSEFCHQYSCEHEIDSSGFSITWDQLSHRFLNSHQKKSEIKNVIDYKIQFESDYHQLFNAFKNILLIKNFCQIQNIKIIWVNTCFIDINEMQPENHFKNVRDLKAFREYVDLKYDVDMIKIAKESKLENVITPGLHFTESIYELIAENIIDIIKR
jgi:hypothetical protein